MNKPLNEQQVERTRKLVMDYVIASFDAGPGRMVNTAWVVEQLHELAKLPLDASIIIDEDSNVGADGTMPFQSRVQPWMLECFGAEISADAKERNHRFLEESLELVQSCGCTPAEAHQLVDYVYGRPVGEKAQEVGGVMITLAALCLAQRLDMHDCGEVELARIWTKVPQIRAKQAAKPKHSPLPEAATIVHQTASPMEQRIRAAIASLEGISVTPENINAIEKLIADTTDATGVVSE